MRSQLFQLVQHFTNAHRHAVVFVPSQVLQLVHHALLRLDGRLGVLGRLAQQVVHGFECHRKHLRVAVGQHDGDGRDDARSEHALHIHVRRVAHGVRHAPHRLFADRVGRIPHEIQHDGEHVQVQHQRDVLRVVREDVRQRPRRLLHHVARRVPQQERHRLHQALLRRGRRVPLRAAAQVARDAEGWGEQGVIALHGGEDAGQRTLHRDQPVACRIR
mmetsp:Transcript_17802/g.55259  ORF Transcript_17802/g.55259 Transcript_17802/m.55259 type:complete len:217 (+) Transcript_17802:463-1113(+)